MYADKLAARSFVAERCGPEWITGLYAAAHYASELNWDDLPREFVVKVTHGCGGVVLVTEDAPRGSALPARTDRDDWGRFVVHPDDVDSTQIVAYIDDLLGRRYRQSRFGRYEWVYGEIKPRVFVEQLLRGDALLPDQLRIFCFNGRIEMLLADILNPDDFEPLQRVRTTFEDSDSLRVLLDIEPAVWNGVLEASAQVTAEADMVRVDWLFQDGRPYFSELTNYPASGRVSYDGVTSLTPSQWSERLCRAWRLPNYSAEASATNSLAERHLTAPPR